MRSSRVPAGADDKIYPVVKLATVVSALEAEGVDRGRALELVGLSDRDLASPSTHVSLNQVLRCYRNATRLAPEPSFAYRAGLRFHVSNYGMYGFAILSSTNFRQTMRFAERYHQLATPLAAISFTEEGDRAEWTIAPMPHPDVDAALYRFLVEQQFGIHASLHRDVMGSSFASRELKVVYGQTDASRGFLDSCGCPVAFGQAENKFVFDADWLDGAPTLGTDLTCLSVVDLCDELMEEIHQRAGVAGKVREALLVNLARPTSFNAVARHMGMSTRTLRRRLAEEETSFRKLLDELRVQLAINYLRDTELTVEEIACALGFSEAGNFRQAFHRWTRSAPIEFRRVARI